MAGMVFREVVDYDIQIETFRCKLVTKDTGDVEAMMSVKHPALAIWDADLYHFEGKPEVVIYMIHLVKVHEQNMTKEERQNGVERFEIQCRRTMRGELKDSGWDIGGKEQNLKLNHGLIDIAHWCLKYELQKQYKYDMYSSNCKQFMEALCKDFDITYDAKDWADRVGYVAKYVKRGGTATGFRGC